MLRCTELIHLPSSLTCLADTGRNQQSVTEQQENPITSNVVAGTFGKPWSMLICISKSHTEPLFLSIERNVFSHILIHSHCFISYRYFSLVLRELKPGVFDNCSPPPTFQESQRGFAQAEDTDLRPNRFEDDKGMVLDTRAESEIRLPLLFSCSSSERSNSATSQKTCPKVT